MTNSKRQTMIEVAYDLVSKVHSDICNNSSRKETDDITEETMEILRRLIMLSKKLERMT